MRPGLAEGRLGKNGATGARHTVREESSYRKKAEHLRVSECPLAQFKTKSHGLSLRDTITSPPLPHIKGFDAWSKITGEHRNKRGRKKKPNQQEDDLIRAKRWCKAEAQRFRFSTVIPRKQKSMLEDVGEGLIKWGSPCPLTAAASPKLHLI